jgi:ATP-dependent RNA helicase SUPV3L1/SUV3
VKFGAYHIYVPQSLKPAPRELALILYALKNGGVRQPGITELPHIVLSGRTSFLIDPEVNTKLYELAGFKVAGRRAVRVDILERLADIIRPLIALNPVTHQGELPAGAAEGNGFRVTVEMTSLLGTAGEDFASILNSLGYRVRRTPKVAAPVAEAEPTEAAAEAPAADATPVEATAPVEADMNAAAVEAVEGTPVDAVAEAAEVAEATADLGAPAPTEAGATEAAAEPVKPAEPEFDEVWFPAGRRPDNARHNGQRQHRGQPRGAAAVAAPADGAAAPADGAERPQRNFRRPDRDAGNADGKQGNRPRFEGRRNGPPSNGPREDGAKPQFDNRGGKPNGGKPGGGKRFDKPRDDWREHRPREDRKPAAIDPNSPWAALAALRNPKSE